MYPQLVKLTQCVLSLSHWNSSPERGFSVNKRLLDVHGYAIYEDKIIALRVVKDAPLRVRGIPEFPITRELLDSVSASWSKYEADRQPGSKQRMQRGKRENKWKGRMREE